MRTLIISDLGLNMRRLEKLIISDLHLGSVSGSDLLRREEIRAALLDALPGVDRLILLGDVLELRHGPLRDALGAARPFFEEVGEALAGRELVVVAGNHDHALVEPWLARRGEEREPAPLALEQLIEPAGASPALERIAGWSSPARVSVAYPGLWVRPDVYALHGHYLDSHLTVPTLERLSVGAMSRLLGRSPQSFDCVGDYESVGAPIFAWRDAISRDARTGSVLNGLATVTAWRALSARDGASADAFPETAGPRPAAGSACERWSARSRSRSPRSTAPDSVRCAPTSRRASCAEPACGRSARSPPALTSARHMWSSGTRIGPARSLEIAWRSGAGRRERA